MIMPAVFSSLPFCFCLVCSFVLQEKGKSANIGQTNRATDNANI